MNSVNSLIAPEAMAFGSGAATWEEAITASGELLVKAQVASPEYTERMLEAVREHGPYIVIAPGFALAHARPGDDIRTTGMSFLNLADPVEFGHESNDPVQIVMALAAKDANAHQEALAALAGVLMDENSRSALAHARSEGELRAIFAPATGTEEPNEAAGSHEDPASAAAFTAAVAENPAATATPADLEAELVQAPSSKGRILCVCGNGVGTSLFLKNTLEKVLGRWGWATFIDVEATDTISAKGKAKEADFVLTSRAIADTLGDLGVAVEIIQDFTSQREIDAALRRRYVV